jgi:ABC-type amino acid transport system permease subunit
VISVGRTDLAVLKAFRPITASQNSGFPFTARHGIVLIGALVLAVCIGDAQAGPGIPSIPATILKWTPLLAQGFALNIAMSVLAMAIGTVPGIALGLGLISLARPVRGLSWLITQFFRNAPWLVLLFYCILLCVKRIMPPWMNLYAIVVVATPLTRRCQRGDDAHRRRIVVRGPHRTLGPMYLYVLSWFFIYCYPIARATVAVERRFAVR